MFSTGWQKFLGRKFSAEPSNFENLVLPKNTVTDIALYLFTYKFG